MQHNSIVIQLLVNAAMAQLHKQCDFANFTLTFSFKLNSDDKANKSHISSTCFRNVAFQSARCTCTMKMNESINLTPLLEDAALICLKRIALKTHSFTKLSLSLICLEYGKGFSCLMVMVSN